MIWDKLLSNGIMHSPIYVWSGSYDKVHGSQSNADDISTGASLLLKSYVCWVNKSEHIAAAEMTTRSKGGNELLPGGALDWTEGYIGALHGARFCPVINTIRLSIGGVDFPSADGLNRASPAEQFEYAKNVDKIHPGTTLSQYWSYWHYLPFVYTGSESLFISPTISIDAGEWTTNRFCQLHTSY